MRPSAGETTASGSFGTLRGGSRKNCRMKSAASQNGTDHHPQKYPTISATATAAARKSQPSLAMMGWGYEDTDWGMGNGEWGMGNGEQLPRMRIEALAQSPILDPSSWICRPGGWP